MNSELFTITCLYLVRLNKIVWGYLHQIQENWAFTTTSCVNSHMQEYRDKSEIYNYPMDSILSNKFINGILGVCLTWLDCNIIQLKKGDLGCQVGLHYYELRNWNL